VHILNNPHIIKTIVKATALTAAAALTLTTVACGLPSASIANQQSSGSAVKLRIGAQPYPLYSDVYVAKEEGYLNQELAKEKATASWDSFKSGPLVNEAVAGGNEDAGFMADLPAIIAKSTGQKISIVSNLAYGEKALAVLVPKNSTIHSVADLKGKKVGYAVGSYAEHLLALLLDKQGLGLSDVQSVNLSADDQVVALQSNSVDAIVIWEQYITKLKSEGAARVLADGTGIKRGNMVTYFTDDFASKHPAVVRAYIRAVQRGADLIASDPDKAANAVAKDFGVSPAELKEIWKNLTFTTKLGPADTKAITDVKDFAYKNGILKSDVNISDLINTSYLQ
jgi:sulfonate transport system substrate-binding protein